MLLSLHSHSSSPPVPHSSENYSPELRFSALRRHSPRLSPLKQSNYRRIFTTRTENNKLSISASLSDNGSPATSFDYDLVIIGAGVGGHGAALHAVEKVYIETQ